VSIYTYNMLSMHLLWQLYHLSCMCYLFVSCPNFFFFPSLSCLHPFFVVSVITHLFYVLEVSSSIPDQGSAIFAFCLFCVSCCWSYSSISYHDNASTMVRCANFDVSIIFITPSPHLLLDVWVLNVILIACKNILVTKFSRQYCFSLTVSHAV